MKGRPSAEADVLIVGAGPAGLVLGALLQGAGVHCLILERQSREYVENRARAGFLAANTVRVLSENGLAAGLAAHGRPHDTCAFRGEHGEFELTYSDLGRGEIHTVYPQQLLVADLIVEFLARGGEIRFGTAVAGIHGVTGERPWLTCADGVLSGQFVVGADGRHGVSRRAVPTRWFQRDHGVSWLAILAEAPPSMAAVGYAIHERGFAGHMARTAEVTRYYLQVPAGEDPETWPDTRIWDELGRRMRTARYGALKEGRVTERRVVGMTSQVLEKLQHGRLFLLGDAASLISPSAAKGANLAVMAAEILARALIARLKQDDERPLARYSADCLPRIWRAQEFSAWMIALLHGPAGGDGEAAFGRELHNARLESLRTSRTHQDFFAENYVGI